MNKKVLITEVCDILVGRTPSRYNPLFWGEGFPWLSIADMNQGELLRKTKESITELAVKECNCKLIPKNTVLFSFKLSIGKVGISAIDIFTNEAIAAFRIKDIAKLDTKYLFYTLKSTDYSVGSNKAVMGKTLNKEQLKKFTIPLPSIEEQRRIIKTLDLAQSLIEKRKQAIAYLDDYIKAVFLDIFGDPVSNPKGWEVVEFEKLVTSIKYGVGSPPQYSEDGYKFIRATDIKKGYIIDSDIKRISPEEANKILKCKLSTNDLIIVRSGVNAGDSAIITKKYDGSFAGYDLIVKLNSLVNPVFIGNLFTSNYLEAEIKPLTRRAAQPHINSDQVKKLKIILPKIEMQKLFAKKVGQIELLKQKMLLQLKELENNFQAELQRAFQSD